MAEVTIREAAARLKVSGDTIRRRIERGELIARKKDPTDPRSPWLVEIGDPDEPATLESDPPTDRNTELERALHYAAVLEEQLQARTREVAELHQLLASRMLPARLEHDGADTGQDGAMIQHQGRKSPSKPLRAPGGHSGAGTPDGQVRVLVELEACDWSLPGQEPPLPQDRHTPVTVRASACRGSLAGLLSAARAGDCVLDPSSDHSF